MPERRPSSLSPVVLTGGRTASADPRPVASWTNSYCGTCLRTRRFYDRTTHLVCETCSRHLHKTGPSRRSAG